MQTLGSQLLVLFRKVGEPLGGRASLEDSLAHFLLLPVTSDSWLEGEWLLCDPPSLPWWDCVIQSAVFLVESVSCWVFDHKNEKSNHALPGVSCGNKNVDRFSEMAIKTKTPLVSGAIDSRRFHMVSMSHWGEFVRTQGIITAATKTDFQNLSCNSAATVVSIFFSLCAPGLHTNRC